ncbi:hypothetical protein OAH97_00640 [Octadecabacter sp.]|nr:hypothetical protein [Octadecabacter sp.]
MHLWNTQYSDVLKTRRDSRPAQAAQASNAIKADFSAIDRALILCGYDDPNLFK